MVGLLEATLPDRADRDLQLLQQRALLDVLDVDGDALKSAILLISGDMSPLERYPGWVYPGVNVLVSRCRMLVAHKLFLPPV